MDDVIQQLPTSKGTYILWLQLMAARQICIGKLGDYQLEPGWYAYVGSAFGSGGLRGRIKHHIAPVKKPHWHIDYLRLVANLRDIWWAVSTTRYEHEWAHVLRAFPDAIAHVPRFGASDCTCLTHLVYFGRQLDFESFSQVASVPVHRQMVDHSEDA